MSWDSMQMWTLGSQASPKKSKESHQASLENYSEKRKTGKKSAESLHSDQNVFLENAHISRRI